MLPTTFKIFVNVLSEKPRASRTGVEEEGEIERERAVITMWDERVFGLQDCYYSAHRHLHFITAKQTRRLAGKQKDNALLCICVCEMLKFV